MKCINNFDTFNCAFYENTEIQAISNRLAIGLALQKHGQNVRCHMRQGFNPWLDLFTQKYFTGNTDIWCLGKSHQGAVTCNNLLEKCIRYMAPNCQRGAMCSDLATSICWASSWLECLTVVHKFGVQSPIGPLGVFSREVNHSKDVLLQSFKVAHIVS